MMAEFFASAFWTGFLWPLIVMVAQSLLLLVVLLVALAYILLADRKIWAAVQIRRGPNVVGPWGLFQSFADLLKFVLKEPIIPSGANKGVFLLAPLVSCVLALAAWAVIPMDLGWVISDINVGILYIFAISSLSIYGIIMAGWSSNSKYPFLSALRSAAQMVSYEVSIGFVIITVLLCVGSLNLGDIVAAQDGRFGLFSWFWLPLFPMFIIFFISALAETNRPPFDLVEARLMELPVAGLIGALVGLLLGWVDYRVVSGVVEAKLRRLDTSAGDAEKQVFERKIRIMRVLFMVMTVGAFPIIGFLLGQSV